MELERLIAELSRPRAFPYAVHSVQVKQTHISVVFLAGPFVYKVKKPVVTEFLNFGTPARRRSCCEDEVRLNRRTAPEVYLGVVPVVSTADGLRFEADGEPVEWAVKMVRLPEEASLASRLERGAVSEAEVAAAARRAAAFHASAARGPEIAQAACFDNVAAAVRANLTPQAAGEGTAVSHRVLLRLTALTETALAELRPLIERRAEQACEGHGDLRPEHVYLFEDRPPPADIAIIDCVEFSERLRRLDPVSDAAFMVAELKYAGRPDLAAAFTEAYFTASADPAGRRLLPLYTSYRAAVRGKVEGLKAARSEIAAGQREAALRRARGYWMTALGELEEPGRRPALVLVGGLPGTGKSTLAHDLSERADFYVLRSDVIRKELAARAGETDIYTEPWNERTYGEVLRRAEELLFEGRRVLVDANFRTESRRRPFLEAADRWGVPAAFLICTAPADRVRARLAQRAGDASDADWAVYERAAGEWEPPGVQTASLTAVVSTAGDREANLRSAAQVLRRFGLLDELSDRPDTTAALHPAAVPTGVV